MQDKNNEKKVDMKDEHQEKDALQEPHKGAPQMKEEKARTKEDVQLVTIKADEYKQIKEELQAYKDKYVRVYAEFENTRKRFEREKLEFFKYAQEGTMSELLNILDDLERSLSAAKAHPEERAAFVKGIEMVIAHMVEFLKKNNVSAIQAQGKKFDPHCHEALMIVETDEHDEGTVIEEFQKGYYLNDRVLRTAKVKVAKQQGQKDPGTSGSQRAAEDTPQQNT